MACQSAQWMGLLRDPKGVGYNQCLSKSPLKMHWVFGISISAVDGITV